MICHVAVSITKVTILPAYLEKFLTPEAIKPIVSTYLKEHPDYKNSYTGAYQFENHILFSMVNTVMTISNGKVYVKNQQGRSQLSDQLQSDMSTLLSKAADQLFANKLKDILSPLGSVQTMIGDIEVQGTSQQVIKLSLSVEQTEGEREKMDIDVIILPGGKLRLNIGGVSFEEAMRATRKLILLLQSKDIPFSAIGEIEPRDKDQEHTHIKGHLHATEY